MLFHSSSYFFSLLSLVGTSVKNFNIFQIKIFYTDNIVEKVVCVVFYKYIFDFITHFQLIYHYRLLFNFSVMKW